MINQIIYNPKVLRSNLCDYDEKLKNCAAFTKCITNIDGLTIDDAEDVDLVCHVQSNRIQFNFF